MAINYHRPYLSIQFSGLLLSTMLLGCGGKVDEISVGANYKSTSTSISVNQQQDWPWWRGSQHNGNAAKPMGKFNWNKDSVLWNKSIKIGGHASPIILGDKIFIAGATKAPSQSLLCLNMKDGSEIWHRKLHGNSLLRMHSTNSQASATPACDGKYVFVAMVNQQSGGGALMVSAVNLDGEIAWQTEVGPFQSRHGFGSSPVLYKSFVIVNGDNSGPGYLAALDRASGKVVWRRSRRSSDSYATPIIARIGGKDLLLLHGQGRANCYDPATGKPVWDVAGPARTAANTMNWHGDLVFASAGWPEQKFLALKASDGSEVWSKNFKLYVPSFVIHDEHIYLVQDSGIARCIKVDGTEAWSKRLGGSFSSSVVQAGEHLIATSESGTVHVFKANPKKFEKVAKMSLGDRVMSTPVVTLGKVYYRTESAVICLGPR